MASTAIGAMATFAAAAIAAAQQPVPTPIGRGPAYHPAARGPLAARSLDCVRGDLQGGSRVHLEVFANRRVVIVPGPETVHRVFRITLLDRRLEFAESPDDAGTRA